MSKLQKIGLWILGGVGALALFGKQQISFGIKSVSLNGLFTTQIIPLNVVVWIANNTIGRLLIRSVSGALVCNGETVATVAQAINKRIPAKSYVEQSILVDLHNQEALRALFANIQSGDINNLAFEFIGEVVVGEQWPVGIKFNRVFTWAEISRSL